MPVAAPRTAWTTRKAPLVAGPKKVKVVFVHHTAAPSPAGNPTTEATERSRMLAIESTHVNDRGWAAIGYSKVVFGSGRAYDGRGWGFKQGANYDGGTNESTYSICFDGDFTSHPPTDAAFSTAAALIAEGVAEGWIDPAYVLKGHREEVCPSWHPCAGKTVLQCTGKDCPGKSVYTQFDRLKEGDDMALADYQEGIQQKLDRKGKPAPNAHADKKLGWAHADALIKRAVEDALKVSADLAALRTEYDHHIHITQAGKPTGWPVKP